MPIVFNIQLIDINFLTLNGELAYLMNDTNIVIEGETWNEVFQKIYSDYSFMAVTHYFMFKPR